MSPTMKHVSLSSEVMVEIYGIQVSLISGIGNSCSKLELNKTQKDLQYKPKGKKSNTNKQEQANMHRQKNLKTKKHTWINW